ncbi:MAG TPA: hypothetical protein VFR07_10395 [Mycobacteriales bacterium]|jgi:hypothetical protein|nr:hypothetical protein [Mycobacteriales bacterium]
MKHRRSDVWTAVRRRTRVSQLERCLTAPELDRLLENVGSVAGQLRRLRLRQKAGWQAPPGQQL